MAWGGNIVSGTDMTRITIEHLRLQVEETNRALMNYTSLPPRFGGDGSPVRLTIGQTYGRCQVDVGNSAGAWWMIADGSPRQCIKEINDWFRANRDQLA